MNTEGKVFLTDANYKHTLAAIRSLGNKGLKVDVGSIYRTPLGAFSKYTNQCVTYPNAKRFPKRFLDFILKIAKRNKYDVIIPVGYISNVTLSKFKDKMEKLVKIPVANYEQLRIAAHKDKTITLAKKLGIPIPDSILMKEIDSCSVKNLKYPLVLKGITESGRIRYVSSPKELIRKDLLPSTIKKETLLAQEYVKGIGYGFFALFNHGKPRAIFMHKRIREYPITGGPSTVAESVYEPEIKEYGLKILKALNWHGVAMIEFKKDDIDNDFKLMEINAKFWGSLDLAIASGVDFPYLLYCMATEGDVKPTFSYRTGVKFMWPFPEDLMRTLASPWDFSAFIRDLFDVKVRKNIKLNDLTPSIIQWLVSTPLLWNGLRNYEHFRYPHGTPRSDAA